MLYVFKIYTHINILMTLYKYRYTIFLLMWASKIYIDNLKVPTAYSGANTHNTFIKKLLWHPLFICKKGSQSLNSEDMCLIFNVSITSTLVCQVCKKVTKSEHFENGVSILLFIYWYKSSRSTMKFELYFRKAIGNEK